MAQHIIKRFSSSIVFFYQILLYNTITVLVPTHTKHTLIKCSSECGVIVDELYSSRETVPNIRAADEERTSPELHPCPTDNGRSGG